MSTPACGLKIGARQLFLATAVLAAMTSAAPPASWTRPVAVPYASGPAFPLGRDNRNRPDPQYAAEKAIDGDRATFCCLLDDTLDGRSTATVPRGAKAPVTGHMIFDLGRPLLVTGARLIGRKDAGGMNPKQVDFFYFADDQPARHPRVDDLEHDPGIRPLVKARACPALAPGAAESLDWEGVVARYVGLRVNDSYESGGGGIHFNFQIAEMEFFTGPKPEGLAPGSRLPASYGKKDALAEELVLLRAAVEDLARRFPGRYQGEVYRDRLCKIEKQLLTKPAGAWDGRETQLVRLREELDLLKHEALVTGNPLLSPGRLIFVKRYTYTPGWYYSDIIEGARRFGGNLCVLSLPDGKVTELLPEMRGGIFDRFDLSFDGARAVFGYRSAPGKGFRLYEVGTDGRGLRQLTFDPPDEPERIAEYWHPAYKPSGLYRHQTDDVHPCYLPDGGIAFVSTRCERGVLCMENDALAVTTLYRIEGDGSRMTMLSRGALCESTPSVMNDGRVLYTRWEYVDKGVIAVQSLWSMRPDGSGSAEVFGNDHAMPPVLIHGRAVPGDPSLFVVTATLHHPFAVGPIALIDTREDIRTLKPLRWLTRDTGLSIDGPGTFPSGENYTHFRNGRWVAEQRGPLFCDPYPLADPDTGAGTGTYFLVACNPDRPWHDPAAYGLWLIDSFGNRVPLLPSPASARGAGDGEAAISCWQPMPLRPRPRPPIIPSTPGPETSATAAANEATVVLSDVYAGLQDIPRGAVKYLRVWEQVPRPWAARRFWPDDSTLGQHAPISLHAHIYVKVLHGIVPVHEDGSAHFLVPAGRNLFFQAIDADFMELDRMRTFVDFQPGESRSCRGCHVPRHEAPPPQSLLALRQPPVRPAAQPGETAPRPLYYPADVQLVLDRHCVRCHGPKELGGGLDLSGEPTQWFSRSYENLIRKRLVAYVQEFIGPDPEAQKGNTRPLPPKSLGSHASPLVALVRKGHYDAKLTREEWVKLVTWIDANCPYYGSYFGRRNLIYKDHPDFRPPPTLESAVYPSGSPPAVPRTCF